MNALKGYNLDMTVANRLDDRKSRVICLHKTRDGFNQKEIKLSKGK